MSYTYALGVAETYTNHNLMVVMFKRMTLEINLGILFHFVIVATTEQM